MKNHLLKESGIRYVFENYISYYEFFMRKKIIFLRYYL